MSDRKTNQDGFNIDPRYKPKIEETIENHRVQLEPMTYATALHMAWVQVNKSDLDEEVKKSITSHLAMIYLRGII